MNPESVPFLAPFVRLHRDRLNGEPLLLGPEIVLELTESGAEVLNLCDGERSLNEIAEKLAAEYDAPPEAILDDASSFLGQLADRGYVRWQEGRP